MNGTDATPAPEVPTTDAAPKAEGPKENREAANKAFDECRAALSGLHINDVQKTLNALSVMHFGR